LAAIRDELAGRAFPLGYWPQFDLRVTLGAGPPTVHCAFDVALHDAPSVHFLCRELMRFYADPHAVARPGAPLADLMARRPALRARPEYGSWQSHWEARVAEVPPGPDLPPPSAELPSHPVAPAGAGAPEVGQPYAPDRRRIRLEGRLSGWHRLVAFGGERGVGPDALLLAAFIEALAAELGNRDFAVPVVAWNDADGRYRPGELTVLSWVRAAPAGTPLPAAAARYQAEITGDRAADAVEGLGVMRRRIMRERGRGRHGYPAVYSSVVDLSGWS